MPAKYIQRVVNLEPSDYRTVKQLAQEKGLGGKGFSAALRMIIREWRLMRYSRCESEAFAESNEVRPAIAESSVARPLGPGEPG